jgi:hypothetical protein
MSYNAKTTVGFGFRFIHKITVRAKLRGFHIKMYCQIFLIDISITHEPLVICLTGLTL